MKDETKNSVLGSFIVVTFIVTALLIESNNHIKLLENDNLIQCHLDLLDNGTDTRDSKFGTNFRFEGNNDCGRLERVCKSRDTSLRACDETNATDMTSGTCHRPAFAETIDCRWNDRMEYGECTCVYRSK